MRCFYIMVETLQDQLQCESINEVELGERKKKREKREKIGVTLAL